MSRFSIHFFPLSYSCWMEKKLEKSCLAFHMFMCQRFKQSTPTDWLCFRFGIRCANSGHCLKWFGHFYCLVNGDDVWQIINLVLSRTSKNWCKQIEHSNIFSIGVWGFVHGKSKSRWNLHRQFTMNSKKKKSSFALHKPMSFQLIKDD